MKGYELTVAYWDQVFEKVRPYNPKEPIPQELLENALDWLAHGADSIIDYGCGSGRILLRLIHKGVQRGVGIDLSQQAIHLANTVAGEYGMKEHGFFISGGLRCLHALEPASFKGAVVFNIIDNMLPEDALDLIKQIHRVLTYRGRVLLKLNAWQPRAVIDSDPSYRKLGEDFYQNESGLYLWNISNETLEDLLTPYFFIEDIQRIHFPHYETDNRLFYLRVM